MGKYDHLENLRKKIAERSTSKKTSSILVSLWLEFDECLKEFKSDCKENEAVIKKLRKLQSKIRETIDGGTVSNG